MKKLFKRIGLICWMPVIWPFYLAYKNYKIPCKKKKKK